MVTEKAAYVGEPLREAFGQDSGLGRLTTLESCQVSGCDTQRTHKPAEGGHAFSWRPGQGAEGDNALISCMDPVGQRGCWPVLHRGSGGVLRTGDQPVTQPAPQGQVGSASTKSQVMVAVPHEASAGPPGLRGCRGWRSMAAECPLCSSIPKAETGTTGLGQVGGVCVSPAAQYLSPAHPHRHLQLVGRLLQQHLGRGPGGQPEELQCPSGGGHRAGAAAETV